MQGRLTTWWLPRQAAVACLEKSPGSQPATVDRSMRGTSANRECYGTLAMQHLSVPPTDADHVLGRLDAPLVIVEYGDYDCPHTRRAHSILQQLMSEETPGVALVFRHFPLRHLHQNAQKLAELMQAIVHPERYWVAHERLMAQRHMSLQVAAQELTALGLDVTELALHSVRAALLVQADVERGLRDGVHSTPSFFFNGAPHDGHYDLDTLRLQVAAAPARLV